MKNLKIMVMGIGGAGNNEIDRFLEDDIFLNEIEMVAVNTDKKDLDLCKAENKLLLGKNKLNGSGVNANPELAKEAAEESIDDIKCAIEGVELLFLVCGMGGGTGTGATPIIARTAKEMGIVTVALVTTPFRFEDRQRIINAERGVNRLTPYVDTIVVASNDLPLEIFDKDTTMSKALSFMHTFWFTFVYHSRCYLLKKNIFKLFLEGLKGKGLAELSFGIGITAKEAVEDALNQPWIKSKRNSIRSAIYFFEQNISEEDIKELSGLKIPFDADYLESEDNTEDIIVTTILYTLEQAMEL